MTFNQLITEEEEINTLDKVITAIERGRVPGVKSSSLKNLEDVGVFNYQLRTIITAFKYIPSIYRNAAIKMAVRNFINKDDLSTNVDAYLTYFNNRNKKEAKTTYKQLFTDFEEGEIKGREFEKQVNEIFKDKAVGKEDATKLYEDDEWLMVIPKTYAASCKYGEGTKWCTTGSKKMFDNYSNKSPLIIIINKKTNKKYQAHSQSKSFMNEKDEEPKNLIEVINSFPNKIQELLKQYKFNIWNKVLINASRDGKLQQVKQALDKGANIHASNDIILYYASEYGHIEVVKLLLDRGANIHADNDYVLYYATKNGYTEIVKLLKQYMKKEKK